jgi:hypothetical protein
MFIDLGAGLGRMFLLGPKIDVLSKSSSTSIIPFWAAGTALSTCASLGIASVAALARAASAEITFIALQGTLSLCSILRFHTVIGKSLVKVIAL